jgi:hypothetical protein
MIYNSLSELSLAWKLNHKKSRLNHNYVMKGISEQANEIRREPSNSSIWKRRIVGRQDQ